MERVQAKKTALKKASAKRVVARDTASLGMRLRGLRRAAKLSLSELAQQAGVSVGMISQIERNLANPSVRTLERLRQALGVPLTTLLEGDDETAGPVPGVAVEFVRRVGQRPRFTVGAAGLAKELLSPHGDHDMQFMIITVPPRALAEEVLIGPGEKAGLVLDGEMLLTVGDRTEQLGPGDSFQFSSLLPHSVKNEGDGAVRILWIMNTKPPAVHW